MKREIKFRAWVNGIGEPKMIEWDDIDAIEMCNDKLWHHYGQYTLLGNLVLMQYTWLKDNNGKDIYEGDILGIPELYETPEMSSNPTIYWEVVFHEGQFTTQNNKYKAKTDSESLGQTLFSYDNNVFVAGNIYENPELLNQ